MNSFYFGHKDMRKSRRVTVRLDNETFDLLEKQPCPYSDVIRDALKAHFADP